MNDPTVDSFSAWAEKALKREAEVKQLVQSSAERTILVGRDDELEALRRAFARVSADRTSLDTQQEQQQQSRQPRVLCIWGESGCGKSMLVKAARVQAESSSGSSNLSFGSTSDGLPYICYGKYTLEGRGDSGLVRCIKDLVRQVVDRDWDMGIRRSLQESISDADADVLIETFPALSVLFDSGDDEETIIFSSEMDKTRRGKRRRFLCLQLFQALTNHKVNQYRDEDIPEDSSVDDQHDTTRPIIMILDDMQWACQASMDIITSLVRDLSLEHFLLIATSRPPSSASESGVPTPLETEPHLFEDAMVQWKKLDVAVEEIHLKNFDNQQVNQLVAQLLETTPATIAPLGTAMFQKTRGHPMFTTEFLLTLVDQKMVKYDFKLREWTYNIPQIQTTGTSGVSSNTREAVIGLFQSKFQSLSSQQHRVILQVAACLGASFTKSFLNQILRATMILTIDGNSTPLCDSSDILDLVLKDCVNLGLLSCFSPDETTQSAYFFVHDLAREATLLGEPDDESKEKFRYLKLQVGRCLVALAEAGNQAGGVDDRERQSLLLLGVDLCNEGYSLFSWDKRKDVQRTEVEDLMNLARQNLLAGHKAVSTSAFDKAVHYMETGLRYLNAQEKPPPGPCGNEDSQLSLKLLAGAAEATYCNGDFEKMQIYSDSVLSYPDCPIATQNKMATFQILSATTQERHLEALVLGCKALETLGVSKIPTKPTLFHVCIELHKTKRLLRSYSRESLLLLPLLRDENRIFAMRISDICLVPAFLANQNFWLVTVLRALRWSVKYGICQYSPTILVVYGLIQGTTCGDAGAYATFSDVALKLAERIGDKETISRTSLVCFSYCRHWVADMRSCIPPLAYSQRLAMEVGDTKTVLNCMLHQHFLTWCTSKSSLPKLGDELHHTVTKAHETKHLAILDSMLYMAKNLRRLCSADDDDNYAWLDKANVGVMRSELEAQQHDLGIQVFYDSIDLQRCFLLDRIQEALKYAKRTEGIGMKVTPGSPLSAQTQFYRGMVFLAHATQGNAVSKKRHLRSGRDVIAILRKWDASGNVNCTHRLRLLEAEEARIMGKPDLAREHYTAAVRMATRTLHEQDTALGHECTAKFYLEAGDRARAAHHVEQAARSYTSWGASAKVKWLSRKYNDLLSHHGSTVFSVSARTSTSRLSMRIF